MEPSRGNVLPLIRDTKLWATLLRRHKVVREALFPCMPAQVLGDGLKRICKLFDVSVPIVLHKHERELMRFSRTSFLPGDFLDAFPYTALCLELFSEEPAGTSKHI